MLTLSNSGDRSNISKCSKMIMNLSFFLCFTLFVMPYAFRWVLPTVIRSRSLTLKQSCGSGGNSDPKGLPPTPDLISISKSDDVKHVKFDAATVTDALYMHDVDRNNKLVNIIPRVNATANARQGLLQVVSFYRHNMRALEFCQKYLHKDFGNNTDMFIIIVSTTLLEGLVETVEQQLQDKYPTMYSTELPEADLLYAGLYNQEFSRE